MIEASPHEDHGDGRAEPVKDGRSSLALRNLRGLVIVILIAFHSVMAYLGSLGASPFPFDQPPYEWRAFPILDSQRWFGFDLFCASQDVYLMALMFFLSGLFVWPSLARKGTRKFLADRAMRLGVPFIFGLAVVAPLALYPVYRLTAEDPSPAAYVSHFLALPFWPNGPMWFLWALLALNMLAAALNAFAPRSIAFLGRLSSSAASRPGLYFLGLAGAAALAYTPLAFAFTPWSWAERGPLALQLSRPLLYAVYFFAGLGVGHYGLERGLLAIDGMLARRWRLWLACALGSLLAWMGLTGLTMTYTEPAPVLLRLAAYISYAFAGAGGFFFMMAACLRFGAIRSKLFGALANNALGMYLLHYAPLVWLQYALLGFAWFAVFKAALVFGGVTLISFAATAAIRSVWIGARLIGEEPRATASVSKPRRIATSPSPPLRGKMSREA